MNTIDVEQIGGIRVLMAGYGLGGFVYLGFRALEERVGLKIG